MDYSKILMQLINDNQGVISAKMVTNAGIPRIYLSELLKKGVLRRCERGIYLLTQSEEDEMYCFQMRYPQTTFSHESALYLLRYITTMPQQVVVTVKTGTNTKNLLNAGTRVHSIRSDLYKLGEIEKKTYLGRTVYTYDVERSICDIIRNRSKVDNALITIALRKYNDSPDKDFSKLISYAEKLKVAKIMKNYIEFL